MRNRAPVIDERIAQRRAEVREQRRRVRLRRTVVVALLTLVAVGLVALERSALVALEEVQVGGTVRLTAEQVRSAAGLELGTSTLRLRLRPAEERVTELPLVRSAEARRLDPLTVRIEVVERTPAVLAEGAGERALLDRDGVVILVGAAVEDEPLDGLPVVRLSDPPPPVGGVAGDDPALANAFEVWRGLSGALRAEVERYDARGPDELTLRLRSQVEVRFGPADRLDEKVRALGAVLDDVGATPIETIDVRAPSAPVVIGP
jgi:cell division protein FtsQ